MLERRIEASHGYADAGGTTLQRSAVQRQDALDRALAESRLTDKDGPADVSLTLVETNANARFLLLYYWGTPQSEKTNGGALRTIADSIRALK